MTTPPTSKIIQIITISPEHRMIVLCDDGSVWWMDVTDTVTFKRLMGFVKNVYVVDK